MQTTDTAPNNAAATANSVSPTPAPAQQAGPPAPTTTPGRTSAPPSGIEPEFLKAIDEFVIELRRCAANSLVWQIKMGIHLHQFRDGLGMEDWNQLLSSGRLPFSARTAQTLARIGKHKVLADPNNATRLPDALSILNVIAALPPSVLEQALRTGTIHPKTSLAEAKKLVAEHRAKKHLIAEEPLVPGLL